MAKSYQNVLAKTFSGRVGDIILKNYGGISVMTKRPDCSKVIRSEKQLENQNSFRKSVIYGKAASINRSLINYYKEHRKSERQSIYHAAISDYMKRARIESIDMSGYKGMPGYNVSMKAWNKWKIKQITFMIVDETGYVIEQGDAVMRPYSEGTEWDYTTTMMNPGYQCCKAKVRFTDNNGRKTETLFDPGSG